MKLELLVFDDIDTNFDAPKLWLPQTSTPPNFYAPKRRRPQTSTPPNLDAPEVWCPQTLTPLNFDAPKVHRPQNSTPPNFNTPKRVVPKMQQPQNAATSKCDNLKMRRPWNAMTKFPKKKGQERASRDLYDFFPERQLNLLVQLLFLVVTHSSTRKYVCPLICSSIGPLVRQSIGSFCQERRQCAKMRTLH